MVSHLRGKRVVSLCLSLLLNTERRVHLSSALLYNNRSSSKLSIAVASSPPVPTCPQQTLMQTLLTHVLDSQASGWAAKHIIFPLRRQSWICVHRLWFSKAKRCQANQWQLDSKLNSKLSQRPSSDSDVTPPRPREDADPQRILWRPHFPRRGWSMKKLTPAQGLCQVRI